MAPNELKKRIERWDATHDRVEFTLTDLLQRDSPTLNAIPTGPDSTGPDSTRPDSEHDVFPWVRLTIFLVSLVIFGALLAWSCCGWCRRRPKSIHIHVSTKTVNVGSDSTVDIQPKPSAKSVRKNNDLPLSVLSTAPNISTVDGSSWNQPNAYQPSLPRPYEKSFVRGQPSTAPPFSIPPPVYEPPQPSSFSMVHVAPTNDEDDDDAMTSISRRGPSSFAPSRARSVRNRPSESKSQYSSSAANLSGNF